MQKLILLFVEALWHLMNIKGKTNCGALSTLPAASDPRAPRARLLLRREMDGSVLAFRIRIIYPTTITKWK
jgi:hypothetical protein